MLFGLLSHHRSIVKPCAIWADPTSLHVWRLILCQNVTLSSASHVAIAFTVILIRHQLAILATETMYLLSRVVYSSRECIKASQSRSNLENKEIGSKANNKASNDTQQFTSSFPKPILTSNKMPTGSGVPYCSKCGIPVHSCVCK